jgi:hypothetical protein
MFDEPWPDSDPRAPNEHEPLPFDRDAADDSRRVDPVDPSRFLFLGQGLTAEEFAAYVRSYDFGTVPPDFVVLHHTAIPCTRQAAYPGAAAWDAGEDGLSPDAIKSRRGAKLAGIKEHYRTDRALLWDRGPHLFIDDRWIWLFTPMREIGIHAREGNSYREGGRLHYSIGIEVVGYYEHVRWPEAVERLVAAAIHALRDRLDTFEIRYAGNAGAISSHRDYNKPQCPGAAITEDYYISAIRNGRPRLAATGEISEDSPLLGPASGSMDQAVAYIRARLSDDSEYLRDVETIMGYYWRFAPPVGVDPFLAAAQCIHETDALRSYWAARPRRNPAGLGVVSREEGLAFESWEASVQAHIGQLLAFALRDEDANDSQRAMMQRNPRHHLIAPELRGSAPTLRGLNNRWTSGGNYAASVVARANAMRQSQ